MKGGTEVNRTEALVLAALAGVLRGQPAHGIDATRENTPNWDSLRHIEIIFAVEDAAGVEFREDELPDLDSVRSIVEAIGRRRAP